MTAHQPVLLPDLSDGSSSTTARVCPEKGIELVSRRPPLKSGGRNEAGAAVRRAFLLHSGGLRLATTRSAVEDALVLRRYDLTDPDRLTLKPVGLWYFSPQYQGGGLMHCRTTRCQAELLQTTEEFHTSKVPRSSTRKMPSRPTPAQALPPRNPNNFKKFTLKKKKLQLTDLMVRLMRRIARNNARGF